MEEMVPLGAAAVGVCIGLFTLLGGFQGESLQQPSQPDLSAAQATTTVADNPQAAISDNPQLSGIQPTEAATPTGPQGSIQPKSVDLVKVSLAERTATLYQNGKAVKTYPVGIGKPSTPTPKGSFQIDELVVDPPYLTESGDLIPPGPDNPLGTRWARFSSRPEGDYGFHGGRIDDEGSLGCVRLREHDLHELYTSIRKGTRVEVY